jgi:gluconate 2-dehydrogenase gamma chain
MDNNSRRLFVSRLLTGLGATVAWNSLADFTLAQEHAANQLKPTEKKFIFFTPEEALEIGSVAEQIVPSDDGPGAREAGAIYFMDHALSQTEPSLQPLFRDGLAQLAAASAPHRFSELSADQKIGILKKLEKTEFFRQVHLHTIYGFLGSPTLGGNRNEVGWKYIGFDNSAMFSPPFGYYDAELLKQKKQGES